MTSGKAVRVTSKLPYVIAAVGAVLVVVLSFGVFFSQTTITNDLSTYLLPAVARENNLGLVYVDYLKASSDFWAVRPVGHNLWLIAAEYVGSLRRATSVAVRCFFHRAASRTSAVASSNRFYLWCDRGCLILDARRVFLRY